MITKRAGKIWIMLVVFLGTSVLPFCVNALPETKHHTSETPVIYNYDADDTHWLLRSVAESEETTVRVQVVPDTTPIVEFHAAEQMVKIAQIVLYEQNHLARQFIYLLISVLLL
jgi:hypothetical protein